MLFEHLGRPAGRLFLLVTIRWWWSPVLVTIRWWWYLGCKRIKPVIALQMGFHFRRWWPVSAAASFMYVRLVLKVVASFVAAALVFGSVGLSNNKLLHSPSFDFVTLCVSACFSLLCRSVSALIASTISSASTATAGQLK